MAQQKMPDGNGSRKLQNWIMTTMGSIMVASAIFTAGMFSSWKHDVDEQLKRIERAVAIQEQILEQLREIKTRVRDIERSVNHVSPRNP